MGWAKYCEDNMSIYIGRMAVQDLEPVFHRKYEKQLTKKEPAVMPEKTALSEIVIRSEKLSGRRGLELILQNGVEDSMIRKLQINGWWWSKVNTCWCNLDTKGNRKYAEALFCIGAKVLIIA